MQKTTNEKRQRGFALVAVLWIVVLLALQVSTFNLTIRDAATLAGNELAIARGEALTAAGVELAVARLMEPDESRRWRPDGRTREVGFGGARLYITMSDEAGRLDVNRMDAEVLDALVRPLGGSVEALLQWRDRNGPLRDPSELARALGLSTSAIRDIAPHLTVYGGGARINPLAASRGALLLLPGADPAEVDSALRLRRTGASALDVARALGSVDKWLTERTGPAYRVEVAVRGQSPPAIGWAEAIILVGKDQTTPFRVLSWRYEPRAAGG